MTKGELRRAYLERRSALSPAAANRASRDIAELFFRTVGLAGVRYLHTFIRIARFNEVDTSAIYYRVWRSYPAVITVAPRGTAGGIENVIFDIDSEWAEGDFGIREPAGTAMVEPKDIDVCIVPLLAFDRAGHRVGYGKGIYDRLLAGTRDGCLKVGVSYFEAEAAIPETHENDVALDICITPTRAYDFRGGAVT